MKIRFLTLLTTLAFLGLCVSVPAFAGKEKNCDPPDPHPSCKDDGAVLYTAELIGDFNFHILGQAPGAVNVTLTSKELGLIGNNTLDMNRSDGDSPGSWNKVFNTCTELWPPNWVSSFIVGADDWEIGEPGAVKVAFHDILVDPVGEYPGGEVTVHLWSAERYPFLPPDPTPPNWDDEWIDHELIKYTIWGRSTQGYPPRRECQPPGTGGDMYLLPQGSNVTLRITARRPTSQ